MNLKYKVTEPYSKEEYYEYHDLFDNGRYLEFGIKSIRFIEYVNQSEELILVTDGKYNVSIRVEEIRHTPDVIAWIERWELQKGL